MASLRNLRELPKFRDGLSYLYIEHGRIEQEAKAIAWYGADGKVSVPAAALGVLMLGPGTSITHEAIKALADNGCLVNWVGEDAVRFYAGGTGETRSSSNLMRQAQWWAQPNKHLQVVRRMYTMRFAESLPSTLTLEQIRGREGVRVRTTYAKASKETGVPWRGRSYKRGSWGSADPINRALSAGSACLYGVCHAAIVSAGYSPALGFIHTGKQLSFVYDIADLYKTEVLIPAAFRLVAESDEKVEGRIRHTLRDTMKESRLLERVVSDLHALFSLNDEDSERFAVDGAAPGELWDPSGNVEGGVSYGGNDPREGSDEPQG